MRHALAFLCALVWIAFCALGVMYALCASPVLMTRLFDAYADKEAAGLDEGEYARVAEAVTGYLTGRRDSLDLTVSASGEPREAFDDKEKSHMVDVRALTGLCGTLALGCAAAGAALLGVLILWKRKKTAAAKGARDAALCVMGLMITLGLWALINFNGLLYAFHLVFFTGERTWLLNPARHLLIQLMPAPFFSACACLAGGAALLGSAVCLTGALRALKRRR